jgi:Gpi18-like mannosyltransferase
MHRRWMGFYQFFVQNALVLGKLVRVMFTKMRTFSFFSNVFHTLFRYSEKRTLVICTNQDVQELLEGTMLLKRKLFVPDVQHLLAYSAIGVLFVLALVLRVSLFHVETSDYTVFVSQWYDFIQSHGGFAALKYNFSNYNVPYLYLLALTTYLPISKLIAIKTLSVVFDGVLGLFTYLILSLRYKHSYAAIAGALVVVFAPTIFINSAAWGQCDAIYTAFCLGSLYFLLKERPAWACVFFALALSFKLQAIFLFAYLVHAASKKKASSEISRSDTSHLPTHARSSIYRRSRCTESAQHLRRTGHE